MSAPIPLPMKALLITKSAVEIPTGLLLLASPATLVWLLLGLPLATRWFMVARALGIALLALGFACWLNREGPESRWANRLILGLLAYDLTVVVLLLTARLGGGASGMLLWPGILLHAGLALWSLSEIRKTCS
jgi:hypothetical protein